jgi:hypothetical protein
MIFTIRITAIVMRRAMEHVLRVLEAQLLQYFESEIRSAIERETISERVANIPP